MIIIIASAIGIWMVRHDSLLRFARREVESMVAHISGASTEVFPGIEVRQLNPTQQQIISISKQEYAKRPVSYDENVLKYSNGVMEPWCADYVSWVMREAGAPLNNPNSGGWRIPGVLTLKQYYKNEGRYRDASQYTPKTGDVALFVNTNSFNMSRQHTSIVLKVDGDKMTTIGGNELGRLRVSTQSTKIGSKGLVGYGIIEP